MSRQLPKAYLKFDPNIDQTMPDLEGFIRLLCAANRQPHRGRFKGKELVEVIVGKARVKRFVDRGDLVEESPGVWYVDAWDEWQEGDATVGERMARLRERRESRRNAAVTEPSPDRRPSRITTSRLRDSKTPDVKTNGDLVNLVSSVSSGASQENLRADGRETKTTKRGLGLRPESSHLAAFWDRGWSLSRPQRDVLDSVAIEDGGPDRLARLVEACPRTERDLFGWVLNARNIEVKARRAQSKREDEEHAKRVARNQSERHGYRSLAQLLPGILSNIETTAAAGRPTTTPPSAAAARQYSKETIN